MHNQYHNTGIANLHNIYLQREGESKIGRDINKLEQLDTNMLTHNESFENSTRIIAQDVSRMSPLMTVFLYCLHATVFSLTLIGNSLSLITCYCTYKDTACMLPCFIANLDQRISCLLCSVYLI